MINKIIIMVIPKLISLDIIDLNKRLRKRYHNNLSLWNILNDDLQLKIIEIKETKKNEEKIYNDKHKKLSKDFLYTYIYEYHCVINKPKIKYLYKATKVQLLEYFETYKIPKIPYHIVCNTKLFGSILPINRSWQGEPTPEQSARFYKNRMYMYGF